MKLPEIPETWNILENFAQWYSDNNYPIRVPPDAKVYPIDISYSFCIFRQDVYQVELYLAKAGCTSPRHSHSCEQIIVPLGGTLIAVNEDGTTTAPTTSAEYHKLTAKQPIGRSHQVSGGLNGFMFINMQKWNSKEAMNSAILTAYHGPSTGPIHDKLLAEYL